MALPITRDEYARLKGSKHSFGNKTHPLLYTPFLILLDNLSTIFDELLGSRRDRTNNAPDSRLVIANRSMMIDAEKFEIRDQYRKLYHLLSLITLGIALISLLIFDSRI